jgi:hypothetical protein
MSRVIPLKAIKKLLLPCVFAAALATLIEFHATEVSAQAAPGLWSIAVHLAYQDGTEYDYVFARDVPTEDMPSILAACGSSHWTGSVVRYHCFPIAE